MTIQMPDIIVYQGKAYRIWSFPLESYHGDSSRPEFGFVHTGLRRGYVATWGIESGILYLTDIEVRRGDRSVAGMAELFPGQGGKLEASWFSGEIRIHGMWDPTGRDQDRI